MRHHGILTKTLCAALFAATAFPAAAQRDGRLSEVEKSLRKLSMAQLAIVACVLGGFCGGVLTVKRCGSRALLAGLAAGGACFLLLLAGGLLFVPEAVSVDRGGLGLLSGCLCGGAAAGILCAGPRRKRRRR